MRRHLVLWGVLLVGMRAAAAPALDAKPSPASNPNRATDSTRDAYLSRLIDALSHDESFKVRLQAAVLLGRSKDSRAVEPLLQALGNDADYTVRAAAATALGHLGELRAVAPLLSHLAADSDAFVRSEAAAALAQFPRASALPYVMAAYAAEDPAVRKQVIQFIAVEPVPSAEGVLIRALGDTPDVMAVTAGLLAKMSTDDALRILLAAVQHRDPDVRRGAVTVLHAMGSREATTLILEVYERDIEVDEVRDATRLALRDLRRFLPMPQILAEAGAADKHVRARALKLLGVLGGETAQQSLTQALAADDTYIRGTAVMALRDLGNPEVIPVLEKLAEDPANQRILHLIRHTLKQLRKRRDNSTE